MTLCPSHLYRNSEQIISKTKIYLFVDLNEIVNFPQVISGDSPRGGIRIHTHKGEVTTSYLLIQNADLPDSGKYSCDPSNAEVTSIRVHVLNGEYLLVNFDVTHAG